MTKHEQQMIANMASAAWEAYKEAEYESAVRIFPFGYGYDKAALTYWQREDDLTNERLIEWSTLHNVTKAFDIGYEITERASEFYKKTRCWLEGENDGGDFA